MTDPLREIQRLRKTGDLQGSLALIRHAAAKLGGLDPWLAHQYAMCQIASRQWVDAYAILSLLAAQRPANAQVRYQIATCLEQLGQYVEAKDAFKLATQLHAKDATQPDAGRAWFALGSCLYRLGKDDEAREVWEHGLTLPVDSPDGIFQRGLVHLALGHYEQGWKDYEARKQLHGYRQGIEARGIPAELPPEWDGRAPGRVLVYGTQGAGDVIQFSRYLWKVEERTGLPARLFSGKPLEPLLGYCTTEGPWDFSVAADSLPLTLGIPEPYPPLNPLTPRWQSTPAWRRGRRVGVCWKGNPHHGNDRDRSSPIDFRQAFASPDYELVSLQAGEGFQPKDYAETAQVIATLDAVVTVDTSVAHVAGTLGCPTIVIPQRVPDYRWGLNTDTSPWYPSVRVVRRQKWDAWPQAIEDAKRLLKEML